MAPGRQLLSASGRRKSTRKFEPGQQPQQFTGQKLKRQTADVIEDRWCAYAGQGPAGQQPGQGIFEQDTVRVTIEACRGVVKYFVEDEDPVGVIWRSRLVTVGANACLSNTSGEGASIQDEQVVLCGSGAARKVGASARGLMRQWVELRKTSEQDRGMQEDIEVYQQPSAEPCRCCQGR